MKTRITKSHTKIRQRALISTAAVLAAVLIISLILIRQTDKQIIPESSGEQAYSSLFYHYTCFGENPRGTIQSIWKKTSVRLDGETAHLKIGTRILPINLEDKRVEYSSSDESIASVDENGFITAYKPGRVYITSTLAASGASDTAELEIIRPVQGLLLKKSTMTVNISDPLTQMEAMIYPADATNTNIIWATKNPKVAEINSNGALKPAGIGMTEITATTEDGNFTAKCFVTVINKVVNVDSVAIQNKGSEKMAVGESINMIATISPSNAKNKILSWSSSDTNVASISKTGKLKASAPGQATITVTSSNGKTDSMNLTVENASGDGALNLYGKVTSNGALPTDILGSTYVSSGSFNSPSVTDGAVTYTSYNISLNDLVNIQMGLDPPPKIWTSGGMTSASREETTEYMDPGCYYSGAYKYQFLDLSHSNGVSAEELNVFLQGKGILEGQGQAFVDAAREYNVSEVYLVAHSCLETGNGTSQLSNGVEVNGTTVYNMFGIGAYDNSALYSGSKRAYDKGWTSPEAAIKGGAAWISEWYINASSSRQNTLYKMLWNPETPGQHQYATDIGWAIKQAISIEKIFASFPNAVLSYDIPVYQGQTAITLD